MSKRMIDSSVWRSENFASLPPMARLLMMGMITTADDQGRVLANPKFLRGDFFAYDDDVKTVDVQEWLTAIHTNETIILYTVDGKQYAQFANWWKYQSLQYAMPSKFPKPEAWMDRIRYNFSRGVTLTFNWSLTDGTLVNNTCDESGNPINVKISKCSGGNTQNDLPESNDNQVDNQVGVQEEEEEEEYITTNTKDSCESSQSPIGVVLPEPVTEVVLFNPQQQTTVSEQKPEPKAKATKTPAEKKQADARVKRVIDAFVTARGSSKGINYAQEGMFAKKIVTDYGTDDYESLVIETFQWLKKDDFWKNKPLGLATIFKNIEAYQRYKNRGGSAVNANSSGVLKLSQPTIEWDESKFKDINF